jgi:hypothetical protein
VVRRPVFGSSDDSTTGRRRLPAATFRSTSAPEGGRHRISVRSADDGAAHLQVRLQVDPADLLGGPGHPEALPSTFRPGKFPAAVDLDVGQDTEPARTELREWDVERQQDLPVRRHVDGDPLDRRPMHLLRHVVGLDDAHGQEPDLVRLTVESPDDHGSPH